MRINFTRRAPITRLAALALVAVCLFQVPAQAATNGTGAQGTERILIGIHWGYGIANGQSIRATLANLVPTGPNGDGVIIIDASLNIYDELGRVVAQTENSRILPGKFHSFDIHRSTIPLQGDRTTGRVQVFEELKVFASGLDETEARAIRERAAEFLPASFELINGTGETSVIVDGLSNTILVGERRPTSGDPGNVHISGGSVDFMTGLVRDQALVVNARNLLKTGESISMLVKLSDRNGDDIAVSAEVEIPPGEFRTFRLNYDDLATPGEPGTGRKEVRTRLLWGDGPRRFPVAVSLESVNTSTGRTVVADGSVRFVKP